MTKEMSSMEKGARVHKMIADDFASVADRTINDWKMKHPGENVYIDFSQLEVLMMARQGVKDV